MRRFNEEKQMNLKVLIIAICFFSTSVFADTNNQRKGISTVDDVKEYRVLVLERMNTKLESGKLTKKQTAFLTKKVANLVARPLPTQEQVDKRIAQKRKAWKKRKFQHKRKNK